MTDIDTDICIIGAGAGGLSVAAGAVQMGARVVLIERGAMGGDCLNTGCVPSKSLIAAANRAAAIRDARPFGVHAGEPVIDWSQVQAHVREVIATIAPHDSVARFEDLGVTVIQGEARFTGRRAITVGDTRIRARRFVIATGSKPAVPPIPGLDTVAFETNETIFDLPEKPRHLIILGGGPMGIELAGAFRRLGSDVTLLERDRCLAQSDPALVAPLVHRLRDEGVTILEQVTVTAARETEGDIEITFDGTAAIRGSTLLIAAGRLPVLAQLNLDAAGITWSSDGIETDARLRTRNKRVFAIGDAKGAPYFTVIAGYDAGIVIRNTLFRLPAEANYARLPRVTYGVLELAEVGLSEREARQKFGDAVTVQTVPYADIDRARTTRAKDGLIKVIIGKGGRILGAGMVGEQAGELIAPWTLALGSGLKISAMAGVMAPYPTLGEISKRAAGKHFTPTLYGARMRRLVRLLLKMG